LKWRTKATIQRAFARLPLGSEAAYYQLQRLGGNLRKPESPLPMFQHAAEIFADLARLGMPVEGARVLEVGTGHRIVMPLAFYLGGASSQTSVDLFPILKRDLVMASLPDLLARAQEVTSIFTAHGTTAVAERLSKLAGARDFNELCARIHLKYRAPCDATDTGLPAKSVDIHFSYTVFEHIPGDVLLQILREGGRLLSERGYLCHHIDLSDHYSHSDPSIGKINFLQFSAKEWARIDNPRFGYQNRLRANDYASLYQDAQQEIHEWRTIVNAQARASLSNGFPLAQEYRNQDPETLATVGITAISRPADGPKPGSHSR
jgi:hypothetical protein